MTPADPGRAVSLRLERTTDPAAEPIESLLLARDDSRALLVLGHGAGAGMDHPHLERLAWRLADNGIATLRYQFPYRQQGRGRPDRPTVLEATVRDAVFGVDATPAAHLPRFLGGRSMGARMALRSTLDAAQRQALPIAGLVLFAYPLHRSLRVRDPDPETLPRADVLDQLTRPALFLSGTRDTLARRHLLEPALNRIADRADVTAHWIVDADHSFSTLKRTGRTLEDVERELAATVADWILARAE